MQYSPDGRYWVVFSAAGIAIVNPADGTYQIVALSYFNSGQFPLPAIFWQSTSQSFYTALPDATDADMEAARERSGDATFTVWKISLENGKAIKMNTFHGNFAAALFSPDFNLVSGIEPNKDRPGLSIAQVSTGNSFFVDENAIMGWGSWNPDSLHFLYEKWASDPSLLSLILGGVCQTPRLFPFGSFANFSAEWIDSTHAVITLFTNADFNGHWSLYLVDTSTGEEVLIDQSESTGGTLPWLIR